ncbi:MAG: hypothetical protein ISR76_07490 [Planctomycetes bacterium]|nr:hypothetical protein [Planctomycetota bacterium]
MQKGGRGFPTLQFMDAEGNTLAEPAGREVKDFEATLKQLAELEDLRARIAKGEKGLEAKLFLAELEMGKYGFEEAKEKAKQFPKLTAEQKKRVAKLLLNAEVNDLLGKITSEEAMLETAVRMKELLDEGRIPDGEAGDGFWSILMDWADRNSDAGVFEKALAALKAKYGEEEGAKAYFDRQEARLKEMKEGQGEG